MSFSGCVGRLVTYPVLAAAFLTFLIIGGIIGGLYINTGVQDIQKPTLEVETTGHPALDTPYAAGQHPEDTPYSSGHSAMDTSSPRGHPAHCTSVGKDFTGFTFSALMLKLYTNSTMINFNMTGI
ncbi:uncharacterized protein LOC118426027 [Branchiostoma floridae]|uniref:Uncharacterized protein LOC118426027 n=1 Tax=Branchiostoma floridae TaxID=7739 RepID=A0A9J7LY44_BRAFL|nr:uncharacterized protein LOC118426027 [Branchiostoma floridae]